ncbi:hypothetical protein [Sanguibacter suarezii]|uniref:hypothetical protein n=1 Tax=Sanguibacter suarezii TaxID=60921 RepID=UPI00082B4AF1|nr:hypothetical protein [Sanguibacter suarezii]
MAFKQFDEFISIERGINDWSDDAVLIAESIMSDFVDCDWKALIEVLGRRDAAWRKNLADCLASAERDESLACLYLLLDTDDPGVFFAAAESIQRFDALDPQRIDIEALKKRYASFRSAGSADEADVVIFSELLDKL